MSFTWKGSRYGLGYCFASRRTCPISQIDAAIVNLLGGDVEIPLASLNRLEPESHLHGDLFVKVPNEFGVRYRFLRLPASSDPWQHPIRGLSDHFEKSPGLCLGLLLVAGGFAPVLHVCPVHPEVSIRRDIQAANHLKFGRFDQGLDVVGPTPLSESLVEEDGPGTLDVCKYTRFDAAFHGIAGKVIRPRSSASGQERFRISDAILGKLLEFGSIQWHSPSVRGALSIMPRMITRQPVRRPQLALELIPVYKRPHRRLPADYKKVYKRVGECGFTESGNRKCYFGLNLDGKKRDGFPLGIGTGNAAHPAKHTFDSNRFFASVLQ